MKKYLLIVLLFFIGGFYQEANATHLAGADIGYECLGLNASGQMRYKIVLRLYRDCGDPNNSSATLPTSAQIDVTYSGCSFSTPTTVNLAVNTALTCPPGSTTPCDVSPLCPAALPQSRCNNRFNTYPGIQFLEYTGILTIPVGCSNITISYDNCCRNPSITNLANPDAQSIYVEALINNAIDPQTGQPYCNSSPKFSQLPTPFVCKNNLFTYNNGAIEIDGDSLSYQLVQPWGGFNSPLSYSSTSYTVNNPIISSSGVQFSQTTGQLQFTPTINDVSVLAVKVSEYRNGVLIGYVKRDIQVWVINCNTSIPEIKNITNVQNATQLDTTTVQTCPNNNTQFSVLSTDKFQKNLTVTSTISSVLPGATYTNTVIGTAPNDTILTTFNWTPAAADTGCHYFILNTKNDDCPIVGSTYKVFRVCVLTKVTVTPHNAIFCGDSIRLTATGGSNFSWTPTLGLGSPNSYSTNAGPQVNTTYVFTSDCGTDSAVIVAYPPFTLDAGLGDSICVGNQVQLNATVDNTYSPYTIKWTPSDGLIDPVYGLANDSIFNPIAQPIRTTRYYANIKASNGCVRKDSLDIVIKGIGQPLVAKANPTFICPGQSTQLIVVGNPASCGRALDTACTGNLITKQLGTATTNQSGGTNIYPSHYGSYYKSARHQYLIRASELIALYGSGGKIKSISFNIKVAVGTGALATLNNFTIKMGCTNADSLTGYQGGLTTVYGPKNYTPVSGWNTHKLDFAYDWDGVSNLLIDLCFNQPTNPLNANSKLEFTATTFRSIWYTNDGGVDQCGATGTQSSTAFYYNRPNMRFDMCVANLNPVAWTPSIGANAPLDYTNDTTLAYPQTPQIYTVKFNSQNGCETQDFVFVNVDTSTTLSVIPDTFICSIAPVQLHANVGGSQANPNTLTYTWTSNNPSSPAPPSGVGTAFAHPVVNPTSPTKYTCTLSGGSCTLVDSAWVIVGNGLPVSIAYQDSIKCFGKKGKLKSVILGGTAPFTYAWTGTQTGNADSLVNIGPGTYYLSATDSKGCNGKDTIIITQPTDLVTSIAKQNVLCNGGNSGYIIVNTAGGTPNYNYNWNPANSNNDSIINLTANTYNVTVTDANGCADTLSATITQPTPLTSTMTVRNLSGAGSNDGAAFVYPAGGTTPYTYNWVVGGGTLDSITNKPAGTYVVRICDANNCCIFDTAVITNPPPIILTTSKTDVSCFGGNNGFAAVAAVGGVTPYSYLWSSNAGSSTNDSIFSLTAGNYSVTVTDSNGISVSTAVQITQPSQITATFDSTRVSCFGTITGKLKINATGGTPGYTYSWAPIAGSTDSLINIPAGKYHVTVTDSKGCVYRDSVVLSQPLLLQASLQIADSVKCFNGNNGSATITQTGGTPSYSYTWSSIGGNTATSNSLTAGNYIVTVTDSKNCTDTVQFSIGQPIALSAVFTTTPVICYGDNNGKIKITASGGKQPYSYNWSAGVPNNRDSVTNLIAGKYFVTVTDANNCQLIDSAVLAQPAAVQASVVNIDSVFCFGQSNGKATAQVSVGTPNYSYVWSGSIATTATVSDLAAGNHFVTVTDSKGCKDTVAFTVYQPTAITTSFDSTRITCYGYTNGKLKVIAAGGTPLYNYAWSPVGSTTDSVSNIGTGKYYVTVTDSKGCIKIDSAVLGEPTLLQASLLSSDSVKCYNGNDGKATVTQTGGTPGYIYSWSSIGGNSPTSTSLIEGNYIVTITDSKNCTDTVQFAIGQPAPVTRTVNVVNSHCIESVDGSATITVNGGVQPYSYTWDGVAGSSVKNGLAVGQHIVVTTDFKNCVFRDTFSIAADYVLSVSSRDDSTICFGSSDGRITVTTHNGFPLYNYTWSNQSPNSSVAGSLAAGIYTVTVKDLYNCTAVITDTVYQPTQIQTSTSKTDVVCFGEANGTATVVAIDPNTPFSYLWSNGDTTATADSLSVGTYYVTVTNIKNCQVKDSATITSPTALIQNTIKQEITCTNAADGKLTVNASGGTAPLSFTWSDSPADTAIRGNLAPGIYNLTITDANNCSITASYIFNAPPLLVIDSIAVDSVGCYGYADGSIKIYATGGTPGYTYSLDNSNYTKSNVFGNLTAGQYAVNVKDTNGCMVAAVTTVYQPNELILSIIPQDSTIDLGQTIRLYSITTPYPATAVNSYLWYPNTGLNCADCQAPYATPYDDITYTLTVDYLKGCKATQTVTVFVNDGSDFYIPNAFSPNGDGNNDEFNIYGNGIKTVDMKIFNRWGEKLFDGNNQWKGWDGKYKGEPQPPGVYTYYVEIEYLNNKKKEKKGSILLIR